MDGRVKTRQVVVTMLLRILGPTELWVGDRQVSIGAAKQRSFLALLAHNVGSVTTVDHVVSQLWPSQDRDVARERLYPLASRIRGVLHHCDIRGHLVTVPGGYRLDMDAHQVDLHRIRAHLDQARVAVRDGDHATIITEVRAALSLWRHPPLADIRSDWAEGRRQHLAAAHLDAQILLFDALLSTGEHEQVHDQLRPLLDIHDTDERLAGLWMRALHAHGRNAQACAFYASFQHHLVRELGNPASPQLDALYQQFTRHRPLQVAETTPTVVPRQVPAGIPDFTGREDVLQRLDALATTQAAVGGAVVLDGMPGVGKTSVAVHWAHRHRAHFSDGQLFLAGSSHGPQPPADAASGLSVLLRSLGVPADRISADTEQRRNQLSEMLTGRRILIVLDDITDSCHARDLLTSVPGCLTLITSRNRLTSLAIHHSASTLTIEPFSRMEARALLDSLLDPASHSADAVDLLAELAGGLPLALRVMGHHLHRHRELPASELESELRRHLHTAGRADSDHVSVHDAIAVSDRALPDDTRQLFHLLGLHPGWSIDSNTAAALTGTHPQQALAQLDELARRHLIEPTKPAGHYRLHDLIRTYTATAAAHTLPPSAIKIARRRLLDQFVAVTAHAAAVISPHQPPVPDLPDTTSLRQFRDPADALHWCQAERATLLALPSYAVQHDLPRHAWQLAGAFSGLLDRAGPYTDLLAAHKTAVAAAITDGHLEGRIGSANNLGAAYFHLHHYELAAACFHAGLHQAQLANHQDGIAVCHLNLGAAYLNLGDISTAINCYKNNLSLCRRIGDRDGEAFCLHHLGNATRLRRQTHQTQIYLQAALKLRQQLDAVREQAATHAELAALHLDINQPALALHHANTAHELAMDAEDHNAEAETLLAVARVHTALGMHHQALDDTQRSLDLATRNANSPHRAQALARLAEALAAIGHHEAAHAARLEADTIHRDLDAAYLPLTDLPAELRAQIPRSTQAI